MNIAFFTDSYLPNVDGVAKSLSTIKEELEKEGHKVFIIMPSPTKKEEIKDEICMLKSFEFLPYPDYKIAIPNFNRLRYFIKKNDIEIIHNHGIGLTAWAAIKMQREFNLPSITTFHTNVAYALHYLTENNLIKDKLEVVVWSYLRFLYSKFDVLTVPTEYSKKIIKKAINLNAIVLPNPIHEKFNINRKPVDDIELLHVGRVAKEKNIEYIFPYLKKHKNIRLTIVGKGPALAYYKNKARDIPNIEFTGYVDDETLKTFYKTKTALVFCSEFDTQGLVVGEALYAGMPVIAKKNTAAEELTRLIFDDEMSFINAVKKAYKIKDCKECKKIASRFKAKNIAKKLIALYNNLLKNKGNQ